MITEKTFTLYAAKHYDNPHCLSVEEFNEDLAKIKYLKKIFRRYKETGEINTRLTLNYVITFYNLFGAEASTNMLIFKLKDYLDVLKPFLMYLNYFPNTVQLGNRIINSDEIPMDFKICQEIREL